MKGYLMLMASSEDILEIVGSENYMAWSSLPDIMMSKKNDKPYGLISITVVEDMVVMINSISKDDGRFNFEMIKTIARVIKKNPKVYLMSTCRDSRTLNRLMDKYHEDGINSYFTKGF